MMAKSLLFGCFSNKSKGKKKGEKPCIADYGSE
jgi:hypothetical protein